MQQNNGTNKGEIVAASKSVFPIPSCCVFSLTVSEAPFAHSAVNVARSLHLGVTPETIAPSTQLSDERWIALVFILETHWKSERHHGPTCLPKQEHTIVPKNGSPFSSEFCCAWNETTHCQLTKLFGL